MSNLSLPDAITFRGLESPPPPLEVVESDLAAAVGAASGAKGPVLRQRSVHALPFGNYVVGQGPDGRFVKIAPPEQWERLQFADDVARHVAARGVPAIVTIAPPQAFGAQARAYVYPFVAGRRARATREDAAKVGGALGALHLALRSLPNAERLEMGTRARYAMLRRRLVAIGSGADPARGRADAIQRMAADCPDALVADASVACQATHGDLNRGNVLLADGDDKVFVLDFEDAAVSWLPPHLDLAFAIERFALTATPDPETAFQVASALLEAYVASGGPARFRAPDDLSTTLRGLSLRSLCVLAEMDANARPAPDAEWEKFVDLSRQARERAPLLARLDRIAS